MGQSQRILGLATYPASAAATRFRLVAMSPYLRARGWDVDFEPFLDDEFLGGFYAKGSSLAKAGYLAARTLERLRLALSVPEAKAVLIQREAALIGPPYAELILSAWKRLPIIYDFDDAIWELDLAQSAHPLAARLLKDPNKCWRIMGRAAGVIAGSSYLAARARAVNSNVIVVPTVVSSKEWTPWPNRLRGELHPGGPPRIGWVGTHSTAHQLQLVEPALRQLRAEGHEFELHVVGAGEGFSLETVDLESRPWRLADEICEFQRIDIGLAPTIEGPVYQGKCGLKQLQYMAVGVPFVSSWVGGERDFVVDGENGLVAHSADDWYRHLKALLESSTLRQKLSVEGRRAVDTEYSLEVQGPRVARFVEDSVAR